MGQLIGVKIPNPMGFYDLRRNILKTKMFTGVNFCNSYKGSKTQPCFGKKLLASLIKWLAKVQTSVLPKVKCRIVMGYFFSNSTSLVTLNSHTRY
jgi:hypothetical protein